MAKATGRIHARRIEGSEQMQRLLAAFEAAPSQTLTTYEIIQATGSVCPATLKAELNENLKGTNRWVQHNKPRETEKIKGQGFAYHSYTLITYSNPGEWAEN